MAKAASGMRSAGAGLAVGAVLLLVAASCGDDGGGDGGALTTSASAGEGATTTAAGGGESPPDAGGEAPAGTVVIEGFAFEPPSVQVAAGEAVTWTNQDSALHTVTAGEPSAAEGTFDEPVEPGATVEVTFDEAGTFPYFCTIHPAMTGEVVVS